jgi:hypothetical protein
MMHLLDTGVRPRRQQRTRLPFAVGVLLSWLALLPLAAQEQIADSVLIVKLQPTTTTRDTVVSVGAVATVSGGTPSLRRKVAELDLADLKPDGNVVTVGSGQVSFRLQLAGIEPATFRIEGRQALVSLATDEVSEESLVAAATQAVRQRLPQFVDNVTILPVPPVQVPQVKIEAGDRIRLEARPAPGLSPFGLIRLPVAVLKNGDCCAVIPIYLNVNYLSHASDAERERNENNPILVKPRDMVRLVARIGAMRVTALGEALQEGRKGETVRVRNVDSSKVVAGRVADAQVVEIDY